MVFSKITENANMKNCPYCWSLVLKEDSFLWARLIWLCWRPYAFVDIFISSDFFIFCFTSFCVCCFTLLFWHIFTFGFIKRNLLTPSFICFHLVALLLIIHPTFLFWHFLANLNFFRPTLFLRDLPALFDLSK